jgi:hypothetical protein
MPLEADTMMNSEADLTNADVKADREKIFKWITEGVYAGKLKAYRDYPNDPMTEKEAKDRIVRWDSTAMAEDPNNPGIMVSAPLKFEVSPDMLTGISFNETIDLDTANYAIHKKVSYVSLYTYKTTETGNIVGRLKLFDVKLN